MRIKAGRTLEGAEKDLQYAIDQITDARSGQPHEELWLTYLRAVGNALPLLAQSFAEPDLAASLLTPTYWQIFQGSATPSNLTQATSREAATQLKVLEAAKQELGKVKALAARPGLPVVVDTNILVWWAQPGDIDWRGVLAEQGIEAAAVRLVVPIVVIDELDRQKYGDGVLAQRAAKAIRYLDRRLTGSDPGAAVPLAKSATLEVAIDSVRDRAAMDADWRILMCAADLDQLHPEAGTRVLTNDTNMRLRALHLGLKTLALPEKYRKPHAVLSAPPEDEQQPQLAQLSDQGAN
ncbi:PIN domain-containing protein [Planotetraspora sp. A-T 1434]|uniref:PIN domain-containing protein n=1 Tax=Planotetraspora sp. A-T 1434 TaxID=2979219 RepID=UPI0021C08E3F|nr:PIN domain-containing protein [Planotetraspora sp. A-T 1434]MCT9932430.1 PIN domain-containing protein [Planotetraspora sp. A-T 1434]